VSRRIQTALSKFQNHKPSITTLLGKSARQLCITHDVLTSLSDIHKLPPSTLKVLHLCTALGVFSGIALEHHRINQKCSIGIMRITLPTENRNHAMRTKYGEQDERIQVTLCGIVMLHTEFGYDIIAGHQPPIVPPAPDSAA